MRKRIYNFLFLFILGLTLLFPKVCIGGTLDNWNSPKAYKPRPVLFLHGLNSGPATWQTAISTLSNIFSKYQPVGAYLETMDFQDKGGSIDTYVDGKDGWADRLKERINALLANNKYGFYTNKLNLICYSMGGLAAREFLTNPKYPTGTTDKLILIGVPNLGSPLAYTYKDIITVYKIGSLMNLPTAITFFNLKDNVDSLAKILWLPIIEASEGIKDMLPESSFLNSLNNRSQPSGVQYYGIYGIIGHFLNTLYFHNYYGGDGVVSEKSQLGTGRIVFKENPRKITAFHTDEPAISAAGDNPILQFLDSDKPELEITSPDPGQVTEINETSTHVQGRVYKEYLPADSQLIITLTKQEDGSTYPPQDSFLKASDLWIPNNLDSPVAEFDEIVNFPGNGTYKISCQIKNPANITSDIQEILVNVTGFKGSNIIVHCHNPEGKEIGSITGFLNTVDIYDGISNIGHANGVNPILVSAGHHSISVKFNGITLPTQEMDILDEETRHLTFTFTRTIIDVVNLMNRNGSFSDSKSGSNPFSQDWLYVYTSVKVSEVLGNYGTFGEPFSWSIGGVGWRTYDYNYGWLDEPPVDWTLSGSCSYILTSKNFTTNFNGTLLLSGGQPHISESIYFDCIRYMAQLHLYLEIPTPNSYGFERWYGGPPSHDPVHGDKYVFYYDAYHSTISLTVDIDSAYAFRDVLSASHEYSVPLDLGDLNFYSVPY